MCGVQIVQKTDQVDISNYVQNSTNTIIGNRYLNFLLVFFFSKGFLNEHLYAITRTESRV